jgi:glutamate synthase (NADPH/NADH) large chain
MSGGYAFVLDLEADRVNPELVELQPLAEFEDTSAHDELRDLVTRHGEETGSTVAEALLADWDAALVRFTRVMPRDFQRVLDVRAQAEADGLDEDAAATRIMEVLHG